MAREMTPAFSLSLHTQTPVVSISKATSNDMRRWRVTTPRGTVSCSYILHATNAYVSYLIPHMHGPSGVIPGRGQIIATRAAVSANALPRTAFGANEGFEYWFPRPARDSQERPLAILGGGREIASPQYELYVTDNSVVNEAIGRDMRRFLPAVFPGKFEDGCEPEMEWVIKCLVTRSCLDASQQMHFAEWHHGIYQDWRSVRKSVNENMCDL